jgi:hypothetical protein
MEGLGVVVGSEGLEVRPLTIRINWSILFANVWAFET